MPSPLTRRRFLAAALAVAALPACGTARPTAPSTGSTPATRAATATTAAQSSTRAPATTASTRTAARTTGTATPPTAPAFAVTPSPAPLDAPVTIQLTGCAPGQAVTLRARTAVGGQLRDATATFRADARGVVDPAAQAPEEGTYVGVDPTGLLWSGRDPYTNAPGSPEDGPALFLTGTNAVTITLTAASAGRDVATTTLERTFAAPGVGRRAVGDGGLAGTLFTPATPGPHPGVIVWGGSEGGLGTEGHAALLAGRGFAALALAYFRYAALPPRLVAIPLEYGVAALDFLAAQPGVRGDRLALFGTSRGAELALLVATIDPRVRAVVAYAPSAVAWAGLGTAADGPSPAAWTYRGAALPFVATAPEAAALATATARQRAGQPVAETPLFLSRLRDPAAVAAATIPVERIAGPLLTVAGAEDQLWPSATFADLIAARRRQYAAPYADTALVNPAAGHLIGLPQLPTTGTVITVAGQGAPLATGGTAAGNAAASADAWARAVRFLDAALNG